MSSMARTTSSSSMKGFSVLQPSLGAPLSWMPAVGTKELEQLINAYLPGPASAQEKRATISVDFFEFAAQTGENFKYYPVQVSAPQATPSPPNSAFSTSPALSTMSFGSPSQPSTPAPRTASGTRAVKTEKTDYSHLPGMKILTTDGQDVTNSVSRGCKTKEQREHAHLMRVLKACDACKKKKIRCDPSHKRRLSSQLNAKAVSRPAKKAKKSPSASTPQTTAATSTPAPETSFEFSMDMSLDIDFDGFPSLDIDDILSFNPEVPNASMPQDFYGAVPQDFDFFLSNEFSPTLASSTGSFNSPAQPLTPVGSGLLSHGDVTAFNDTTNSLAFLQGDGQESSLPYMTPGAHGSDYVDFNLYSPANSFIDEEPQKLKAGEKRKSSAVSVEPTSPQVVQLRDANISPAGLNEARSSTGLIDEQQWHFDHSGPSTPNPQEPQRQVQNERLQQVTAGDELSRAIASDGHQRPYHGDDIGRDSGRSNTSTSLHGLQPKQEAMSRNSPVTAAVLPGALERRDTPPVSLSTASSPVSTPALSRAVSPQIVHQAEGRVAGGAPVLARTVCPSESLVGASSHSTPLARTPISPHSLPLAASPTALSLACGRSAEPQGGLVSPHRGLLVSSALPLNSGSCVTGSLQPIHGLSSDSCQMVTDTAANSSSPSTAAGLGPESAGSSHGLALGLGCAVPRGAERESHTSGTIIPATTAMVSRRDLRQANHGQKQQRPVLHDMTANVASSSPQRLLASAEGDVTLPLPVRQLSGHFGAASSVLLTQLAVFGLISMLLIVGLTSLLQMQSPPIAYLLSSSSSSVFFLSLLSTTTLCPQQGTLDTVRSIIRSRLGHPGRRPSLPVMTGGLARAPALACF